MKIKAARQVYDKRIDLYIHDGRRTFAQLKFMEVPEGQFVEPSARIFEEDAQVLMDSLWDCGIRPTEGNGSAGAMRATEKHLEDMRKIAFKFIEKEGSADERE